jgi:quinoprotein glucose dehydrogenase
MKRHLAAKFALLLSGIITQSAAAEIDASPIPVTVERAFAKLQTRILRPIELTHAGDGTNRVFIASQLGKIYVMPNDQNATRAKVFLDLSDRVVYKQHENEEGLLGLAFHPNYRQNGQLVVYYTTTSEPHTSVVSRFRVSPNDPNQADRNSEEELLRVKQPFWNHNGGTVIFGPDGFLYIALGDGGKANDPQNNGQNVQTLLGSILRIDVDRQGEKRNYGIPADNPFVGYEDRARPEIWAYGLRNVWRMAFDRKSNLLWAGDVGQNIWEEINIIQRGGNYGWNIREAKHNFSPHATGRRPELIEPIFEYHHDIGKSITGGLVYRGSAIPILQGKYLYADYVSGMVWALAYDHEQGQVVGNHLIAEKQMPIMSFGEDEQGEAYFLTDSHTIHRFREKSP